MGNSISTGVYPLISLSTNYWHSCLNLVLPCFYRDLFCCECDGKDLAVATYKRNKDFYHSVAATQIAKDLELN